MHISGASQHIFSSSHPSSDHPCIDMYIYGYVYIRKDSSTLVRVTQSDEDNIRLNLDSLTPNSEIRKHADEIYFYDGKQFVLYLDQNFP